MKKILFITPYNPANRNNGDKVYTWDILRGLKHNNSNYVHVVTYENKDTEEAISKLGSLVDKVTYLPFRYKSKARMFLSVYPSSLVNRKTALLQKTIEDILDNEHYDIAMANMLKLTYLIDTFKKYPIKTVYISHNVEHQVSESIYKYAPDIIQKMIYWQDYVKTLYWEKRFAKKFDAVTTICDKDREIYKEQDGLERLYVLRPIIDIKAEIEEREDNKRMAIVCGSFTWLPKKVNLNKLLDAHNISLFKKKDCILKVVGRTEKEEIVKGNKIPNVTVTGPVDNVHPYYDDAVVAIVPEMAGGGFKLKIAEAALHHVPIVALEESITDFNMKPGIHYVSAKNFEDLIERAIALIDDQEMRRQLVKNNTKLFINTYSIEAVNRDQLKIIEEITDKK